MASRASGLCAREELKAGLLTWVLRAKGLMPVLRTTGAVCSTDARQDKHPDTIVPGAPVSPGQLLEPPLDLPRPHDADDAPHHDHRELRNARPLDTYQRLRYGVVRGQRR